MTDENKDHYIIKIPKPEQKRKPNRTEYDFTKLMLELAIEGNLKTTMMYHLRTSFSVHEKYLKKLLKTQLLEVKEIDGTTFYFTTDKGRLWLKIFTELKNLSSLRQQKCQ